MTTKFVLLASMRTGSNLLNSKLNQYPGVVCHGEAFNPSFVGLAPQYLSRFGVEREATADRDMDAGAFLDLIMNIEAEAVGLHMFPGHNPAILRKLLDDREVKKICLRRSVFHSFVSLLVARKTDVWRVTNSGNAQPLSLADKQVVFKPAEFEEYRVKVDGFWKSTFHILTKSHQDHFAIWYRETSDAAKLNRLAAFLGIASRKKGLADLLAKQNPEPLAELVQNWEEMVDYARSINLEHQL